jgi:hypothetical protein
LAIAAGIRQKDAWQKWTGHQQRRKRLFNKLNPRVISGIDSFQEGPVTSISLTRRRASERRGRYVDRRRRWALGAVDEDELYTAIDWLGERQGAIEQALSRKHLRDGTLVLYDVSSSYLEGRCCELARLGYNRDGKKGKLQIVYGLMCAPDGCRRLWPQTADCINEGIPWVRRSGYLVGGSAGQGVMSRAALV